MSSLRKVPFEGKVTWLGRVADSSVDLRAESCQRLCLSFEGKERDCHSGLTRPSCSRVLDLYKKGTIIRNVRQLSILSKEEISQIAANLDISGVDPSSMGASMVIEGIPDFSHLPPSSRILVSNGPSLTIDMENRPCIFTGQTVYEDNPESGHWDKFKPAASGLRGVTAWVEREGNVRVGDIVEVYIPDQRPWKCCDDLIDFDMNTQAKSWKVLWERDILLSHAMRLVYMSIGALLFSIVLWIYYGNNVREL